MATRTNTIEVVFDARTTQLALGTRLDFAAKTIYIPENVSRTFISGEIEVVAHDNIGSATSLTDWLIGIKLGAAAFNDVTQTLTLTNTGDHQTFIMDREVVSYFTSNFGNGASQTCQVGVQFGAVAMLPINVKINLTYEYDDTELRDSGTAESGGASTLTDTDKAWTTDAFAGSYITITGGTGSGQTRKIASNTGTVITTTAAWGTNPAAGSAYSIYLGRVKTVRIPLDSRTAQETAVLTEVGTNQVPNLDTFLPESDKVYRQVWFECEFNDGGNATTNYNLALALDAEAEVSRGVLNQALNTACWGNDHWIRDDMATNAAHAFKARSTTASRFSLLSVVLYVTYEYNHQASTTILNSLKIPISFDSGYLGVSAQPRRAVLDVNIQEPGSITLVQSGVLLRFDDTASVTVNLSVGAQANRAYVLTAGSVQGGPYTLAHRIDSGGAQGAALTLARGKNQIKINAYASSSATGWSLGGWLFLNYTSGKHASGVGAHNHSVFKDLLDMNNATAVARQTASIAPISIPESNWFINGLGFEVIGMIITDITQPFDLSADILSGEFTDEGRLNIGRWQTRTDGELQPALLVSNAAPYFERFAADPDVNRLDVESARVFQFDSTSMVIGMRAWVTYHAITAAVSGTVRGYVNDGSGITVKLFRASDDIYLASTTTAAGGTFSLTAYDDVADVYCMAYIDDNRVGRSKSDPAGSGFDIYISPMLIHPGLAGGARG